MVHETSHNPVGRKKVAHGDATVGLGRTTWKKAKRHRFQRGSRIRAARNQISLERREFFDNGNGIAATVDDAAASTAD